MTITREELDILKAPFGVDEHSYIRGFWYIAETAVCERIEFVDVSWRWTVSSVSRSASGIVVARGELDINGVVRSGVGQAAALLATRTDRHTGATIEYEANEPEKAAATDALRRAARLFGIGRYLLNMPRLESGESAINTKQKLADWLGALSGTAPMPARVQPQIAQTPTDETGFCIVREVEVKTTRTGKKYVSINLDDVRRASLWTRNAFIDAGYSEIEIDTWDEPGWYVLSEPARAYYTTNAQGYHNVTRVVKLADLGE